MDDSELEGVIRLLGVGLGVAMLLLPGMIIPILGFEMPSEKNIWVTVYITVATLIIAFSGSGAGVAAFRAATYMFWKH